ncbi:transthyretin domain protein [Talaromyces marneffei ATCC 18224]|uniref:Transthyretin domain protein n=1 Tax=Talaromyces marneffei (strain ATCC 18224 / CBS 334.59 / QM 7333) TaxID=441960 RepID=B6Q333_TALMQ|nr:transthyretin domain protein [Talaromyces marneffei ATCC 18224]
MDRETHSPRTGERLTLYQRHISDSARSTIDPRKHQKQPTANPSSNVMARDPITCHVLNTLTGTPANAVTEHSFTAITDSDGRIKTWNPLPSSSGSESVPSILQSLPAPDSKTNWSIRFDVGPWFEAQGVESFWPEVEVKFTVRGRGVEGEEGWRHYHVPVLLGPWNYSTYRGS